MEHTIQRDQPFLTVRRYSLRSAVEGSVEFVSQYVSGLARGWEGRASHYRVLPS